MRDHPNCAACGDTKNVEVHHKVPVHVARSLELEPTNLITLCEDGADGFPGCHFRLGHLGNWFNYNRNVDKQAQDELLLHYPKEGKAAVALPLPDQAEAPKPPLAQPLSNPAAASPSDMVTKQAQPETPPRPFRRRRRRV